MRKVKRNNQRERGNYQAEANKEQKVNRNVQKVTSKKYRAIGNE